MQQQATKAVPCPLCSGTKRGARVAHEQAREDIHESLIACAAAGIDEEGAITVNVPRLRRLCALAASAIKPDEDLSFETDELLDP